MSFLSKFLRHIHRTSVYFAYKKLAELQEEAIPFVNEKRSIDEELQKIFERFPDGRGMDEAEVYYYLALRTQGDEIEMMLQRMGLHQNRLNIFIQKQVMNDMDTNNTFEIGALNRAGGRFLFRPKQ